MNWVNPIMSAADLWSVTTTLKTLIELVDGSDLNDLLNKLQDAKEEADNAFITAFRNEV